MSGNVIWHHVSVTRELRNANNNHQSKLLCFTGLSGSGKSSLAHAVEDELFQLNCQTLVLDGDNVRHGLCQDLGFSKKDRSENIRRIAEVGKLFVDAGIIVFAAFISPLKDDRKKLKSIVTADDFIEVYVNCPLEVCESRDVKGMYKRARLGEIKEFTGISAPYEPPKNPDIEVNTDKETIEQSVKKIMDLLKARKIINMENQK